MSLNGTQNNHNGVVEGAGCLLDVLGSATSKDEGHSLGGRALFKHVVAFIANLPLFKLAAFAHNLVRDAEAGSLNLSASCLSDMVHIMWGNAASAENVSVGKELSCQVTDGHAGKNNLGASLLDSLKFVIDDLPFGVNDFLEVVRVLETDLSRVSLGLELELNVKQDNLGVLELLGLLLEAGI